MALDPNIVSFLTGETRYAVLATINNDGSIQQSVMWFDVEGDTIVMNTKRGRFKDRNMLRDPRVSLCFEDSYRYVTLKGRAELIDDPELGQSGMLKMATKYLGAEEAARQMDEMYSKQERVVIRVTVDSVDAHGL
jgi:PPOX class probable F420-dependent enzyme